MVKQYRSLENQGAETRKDDILRAAVCAFVALTQPGKRDCNQIEDLALSIMPYISDATKRYISAALSASKNAPNALVRRLCDESPEICAPLLLKSPALTPLDLVVIVGTKSNEHARIISKRPHLPNPVIEALALLNDPETKARVSYGNIASIAELKQTATSNLKPVSAYEARERLRDIMVATQAAQQPVETSPLNANGQVQNQNLLRFALHKQEAVFVTALADVSGLTLAKAYRLIRTASASELSTALKSMNVVANDAFIMCTVFFPAIASNRSEIKLFLDRYNSMDVDQAAEMVRGWKADEIRAVMSKKAANASIKTNDVQDQSADEIDWHALLVKAS